MPPPATNLILWLKGDAGLYKDTAGTTPATADGDLVALWKDQSGAGADVLQATSANRPALKLAIVNGRPTVRFLQASSTKLATAASVAHGIGTGDFWLAAVFQQHGAISSQYCTLFAIGAFAPAFYWPNTTSGSPAGSGSWTTIFYLGTSYSFNTAAPTGHLSMDVFYLMEQARIAGTVKGWCSSGGAAPAADVNSYAVATSIANAAFNVGWDTSGSDYFSGDIAELLLYKASLNATDQATLEGYLRGRYWGVGPAAPLFRRDLSGRAGGRGLG